MGKPAIIVGLSDLDRLAAGRGGEIVRACGPWWRAALFPVGRALWITHRLDGTGAMVDARVVSWCESDGVGRLGVSVSP